jgi:hypothetical protein
MCRSVLTAERVFVCDFTIQEPLSRAHTSWPVSKAEHVSAGWRAFRAVWVSSMLSCIETLRVSACACMSMHLLRT